jgi:hypothetical protein
MIIVVDHSRRSWSQLAHHPPSFLPTFSGQSYYSTKLLIVPEPGLINFLHEGLPHDALSKDRRAFSLSIYCSLTCKGIR